MNRARSKQYAGFTLIELLVVIAIMGVLFSITIPAFQNMGRGSAARTAANQVRAIMTLARQHAIVHNEEVYVVFPHGNSSIYSTQQDKELAFRSMNIYTESKGYLRPWTYLPSGVLFAKDQSFGQPVRDSKSIFINSPDPRVEARLPFPESDSPERDVRVILFGTDGVPSGRLADNLQGFRAELYLTEGTVNLSTMLPEYRSRDSSAFYSVEVNPLTGLSKVLDYMAVTP